MRIEKTWKFVLILGLMSIGAHAEESNTTASVNDLNAKNFNEERTYGEVAEDLANSGTANDAIFSFGVLSGMLRTDLELIQRGLSTFDRFSSLIGDAGAILGGDALVLGRVQRMINSDTELLKNSHQYDTTPKDLPTPVQRRIEHPDAERVMAEYARVEKEADNEIDYIDKELEGLVDAEDRMGETLQATKVATNNGVKAEEVFKDLNEKGVSAIGRLDAIWFDLSVVINPALSDREGAAKEALSRIKKRKKFLEERRAQLQKTKDWMGAAWWYELLRAKLEEPRSAGLDALGTAMSAGNATPSAATAGISAEQIGTRIQNKRMQEEVTRLLDDAAQADSQAAQHANMMKILNLASAGAKAYQAASTPEKSSPPNVTNTTINTTNIYEAPQQPSTEPTGLPSDPGNGVPIGGTDLVLPNTSDLPPNLQPMGSVFQDRYKWRSE